MKEEKGRNRYDSVVPVYQTYRELYDGFAVCVCLSKCRDDNPLIDESLIPTLSGYF